MNAAGRSLQYVGHVSRHCGGLARYILTPRVEGNGIKGRQRVNWWGNTKRMAVQPPPPKSDAEDD